MQLHELPLQGCSRAALTAAVFCLSASRNVSPHFHGINFAFASSRTAFVSIKCFADLKLGVGVGTGARGAVFLMPDWYS